ncbi:MAG TPA: Gfo/Idh/MocA family oxidoreductase [Bryobacteraceae bacterium]
MTDRRKFLQAAGVAGAFTILKPELVRGSAANSAVRVGLLGCGGRGGEHAKGISETADARLVALADLFPDQMERAKKNFPSAEITFTGVKAADEIINSKDVDAVVIATPAYFHTDHLALAVAAGKHIYLEKPVAVDVANAKRVLELGKKAEGRLSLDVGFQIRSAPPFAEMVRRIHGGALGQIVTATAHYFCPYPGERFREDKNPTAQRVRNWIIDKTLSGDIIVEQNIHVIDICNWVLQGHPLKATARGSKAGRSAPGDDCYSHFDVVFTYPNDVHVSFSSTQFGKPLFDANEWFFGTKGVATSPYSGKLGISGDEEWTWKGSENATGGFSASGAFSDNLAQADSEKKKGWIGSITSGKFHNQAAGGVETALSAMLGRQAAYTGREVTWEELLKSNQRYDAGIDLAKAV